MAQGLVPFLVSVAFISLSGVMMPGPLFAVTMAKGQRHQWAGAFISLGHGAIELPLVVLLGLGFGRFFTAPLWRGLIGFLGGIVLLFIGWDMVRKRNDITVAPAEMPRRSLAAGLFTTLANPYFFLWWATVGASMTAKAAEWGVIGLAVFFVVHWSCDLGWNMVVSATSYRAGHLWSRRAHRLVFGICGLVLAGFGFWFIYGALRPF